jgi:DGQHR domain-containing protein
MKTRPDTLSVRALRTRQADRVEVFSFFVRGADITRIADISRISRDNGEALKGFQRREIRTHVRAITDFLDSGPVLFPNAIILAVSPEVDFKLSRGPAPASTDQLAQSGTLTIPIRPEGERAAWIVDGQQRSLALAEARNKDIPVPVVAFVSADLERQREQFILVNKARPLPSRLIDELLPEVSALLPRDLAARRLPSELCNLLNRDPKSPFHGLIKRESEAGAQKAVVSDTAVVQAIQHNLKAPLGALSAYRRADGADSASMYRCLAMYWSAVRDVFPGAWGLSSTESRLMHSAGIRAMGAVMDQVMLRADAAPSPEADVNASLERLSPHCRWTEGSWEELGWEWNEVQSTPRHIKVLSEHLIRLDRELARRRV